MDIGRRDQALHAFLLHLPLLSHLLTQTVQRLQTGPMWGQDTIDTVCCFFQSGFLCFVLGGFFFFLVETESLLYLGDQHLGKQWIPVQKPTVKFCQTMKVFKGKIIQGKGQSLCYLPLCTDFLSVILNNFESVANLSTIRSFTSESTFFISWKISFLATWVRPHTKVY